MSDADRLAKLEDALAKQERLIQKLSAGPVTAANGRKRRLTGPTAGVVAVVVAVVVGVAVTTAVASIPSTADGQITGCVNTTTHAVRIVDAQAGQHCAATEQTVSWSKGYRYRGAWAPATAFSVLDVVTSGGSSWVAKAASTGKSPATNPTIWGLLASAGAPGAAGAARGWAHVLGDGTVDAGHNVATANVTHPFTSGYCFKGLGFVPHVAVASLDGVNFTTGSTDAVQVHVGGDFGAANCGAGVQVIVHEQIASGTPEPFSIIFE